MKSDGTDPKRRPRRYLTLFPGMVVASIVFVLYVRTLAPTVLGFEPPVIFDSAMLQTGAYTLGIAHPTGYSTYMMLTHLFTYLPIGDVAYRVNLASAVFGAVAVFLVYLICHRLCGRATAAAVGAFAFGVSREFWSQAVIAEVYTLNALLVSAVVLALLKWRDSGKYAFLLLACFLTGISLTHHLTSALLVPAGVSFVLLSRRTDLSVRRFLTGGTAAFVLGLTPYLYFPVRALMDAPLNETDPSTPGRFLMLVTGAGFVFREQDVPSGAPEAPAPGIFSTRLSDYSGYVSDQYPLLLIIVGVVGIFYLVSRDRPAAILLGIPFVGSALHGLVYGYEDYFLFLIPAYLVFGICISVGAAEVTTLIRDRLPGPYGTVSVAVIPAVLLCVCVIGIPSTFREQDRSGDFAGRRTIEAVARYAEPGATVLHHRSSLWYMVLVEGRRRDLTLVDPYRTSFDRYTDMVWPDDIGVRESGLLYGTDDPSGVKTAELVSGRGAVYILGRELDQETVDADDFRKAGFDVVPADERGELYRLVPPE